MEKRNQKGIIIGFLSALIIFIASVFYILLNLYPSIIEIQSEKDLLKEKTEAYNVLDGKGFNFDKFKLLNNKYSNTDDKELQELLTGTFYNTIISKIDNNLYDSSIYVKINDEGLKEYIGFKNFKIEENFKNFLLNRADELIKEKKSDEFLEQKNKLKKVLPIYSVVSEDQNELTDFTFTNYIEKLLNKFELSTNSQIGIKTVKEVENNILEKKSDIYYIPINLDISGTKGAILKFLQFIRNTGDIVFENNDFKFSKKQGSTSQLSEVSGIIFDKYIDSSYKQRESTDSDLLRYLYKTEQNNDIIKVKLDLKFYISKISKSKILQEINTIIGSKTTKIKKNTDLDNTDNSKVEYELIHYNINNLRKIAATLKANSLVNKKTFYKQKAENIFLYLNNPKLKKDISLLKKEIKTTKNIDKVYAQALKYKEIFTKLDYEIYKIAKDLKIAETKIDKETKKVINKSIYPKNYIFETK